MWNVQHMAVLMVKAIPPKEVVKSSIIQPVQGIDETICKILNMNMNQSNTLRINSLFKCVWLYFIWECRSFYHLKIFIFRILKLLKIFHKITIKHILKVLLKMILKSVFNMFKRALNVLNVGKEKRIAIRFPFIPYSRLIS